MPTIQVSDGSHLKFRTLGKGENVLLLHGFGLDSRQWLPFIVPHMRKFRFIIPDLRGHGKSETGSYLRADGLEKLARDIEEIAAAASVKTCHLAAFSMGAFVALQILSKPRSFVVRNYLHIEAGPRFHKGKDWTLGFNEKLMQPACQMIEVWDDAMALQATSSPPRESFQRLLRDLSGQSFPQSWIRQLTGLLPLSFFQAPHVDLRFVHEFFAFLMYEGFDFRADLPRITQPCFLLSGRYSQFFPWESQLWMNKVLDQSELRLYPKSGHGLMFSEPVSFQKDFERFLQSKMGIERSIAKETRKKIISFQTEANLS
jgi:pimeloyl-ACP methyl ester carboxylesterase